MTPTSLRLEEFEDHEFLHAVDDAINGGDWVTAAEIQRFLKLEHPNAHGCIGSRMGHLRTIGVTEYDPEGSGAKRWRLTAAGRALLHARLPVSRRRAIEGLPADQALAFMRELTAIVPALGDTSARVMRRQWRYGDAQRRRA